MLCLAYIFRLTHDISSLVDVRYDASLIFDSCVRVAACLVVGVSLTFDLL